MLRNFMNFLALGTPYLPLKNVWTLSQPVPFSLKPSAAGYLVSALPPILLSIASNFAFSFSLASSIFLLVSMSSFWMSAGGAAAAAGAGGAAAGAGGGAGAGAGGAAGFGSSFFSSFFSSGFFSSATRLIVVFLVSSSTCSASLRTFEILV
jgi:hypothetical protein